jgi:hypothetical protein
MTTLIRDFGYAIVANDFNILREIISCHVFSEYAWDDVRLAKFISQ